MHDGTTASKQPITIEDESTRPVAVKDTAPVSRMSVLESILPQRNAALVISSLEESGMNAVVSVDDAQAEKILAEFKRLGLDKVEKITYEHVQALGRTQFIELNARLKEFTSKISAVETPGLSGLIDDLSKHIQDSELDAIYTKALNAKPTLWARFLDIFDKKSSRQSLNTQYNALSGILSIKGKGLEKKLGEIDQELHKQQNEQMINIKTLENSFELYYKSFIGLREQLALVTFLEKYYGIYLDFLRTESGKHQDLIIDNQLRNAEEIHRDIQDKRLVIHKSMLQMPITSQQNANLITVCKNLLKEIDNTRLSSFPTIRSNLLGLGISIRTQQAMMTNDSVQELDRNLAKMSVKVSGDLTEKGILLSSESRLREADTLKALVEDLTALETRLVNARQQSETNMTEATNKLLESTQDLKSVLNADTSAQFS